MRRLLDLTGLLLALGLTACGGNTGGALVQLPFRAGGLSRANAGPLTVTTPRGWTVTLDVARLTLGPFYFNVAPPPTNAFRGGTVLVQATEQLVVDPLSPALDEVPGGADGETGTAVSVEIGLTPPTGEAGEAPADLGLLRGHLGVVSGTAVLGATSIPFSGPFDLDISHPTPQIPLAAIQRIKGAATNLVFTAASQTLTLRVDPTHWFDAVDFSTLPDTSPPGGARSWDVSSPFMSLLKQGVTAEAGVYDFSLEVRGGP